jgi:hypothetical protein
VPDESPDSEFQPGVPASAPAPVLRSSVTSEDGPVLRSSATAEEEDPKEVPTPNSGPAAQDSATPSLPDSTPPSLPSRTPGPQPIILGIGPTKYDPPSSIEHRSTF